MAQVVAAGPLAAVALAHSSSPTPRCALLILQLVFCVGMQLEWATFTYQTDQPPERDPSVENSVAEVAVSSDGLPRTTNYNIAAVTADLSDDAVRQK